MSDDSKPKPRAADDFEAIRTRATELLRERKQLQVNTTDEKPQPGPDMTNAGEYC